MPRKYNLTKFPIAPGRGRKPGTHMNEHPTALLSVRIRRDRLCFLARLRGDVPPGVYIGQLLHREAERKKLA